MSYQPSVPRSIVDTGNSTTNPLAASPGPGDVFTGTWKEVTEYQSLSVLVGGTAASTAEGTLKLQFSQNGVDVAREITLNEEDVASIAPRTLGVIAQYFRVIYENGVVAQTTFNVQTMLHSSQVDLVSRLNQALDGNEDVHNTRSVITGEDPDGSFKNVLVSRSGNLDVTIGDANDAYSTRVSPAQSLKVANQTNLIGAAFDSSALNDTQWQEDRVASGIISNADGEIIFDSGTTVDGLGTGGVGLVTNDIARFIPANFNVSHTALQIPALTTLPTLGTNTVYWGPFEYDPATLLPINGCCFKMIKSAGGSVEWFAETYKSGAATNSVLSSSWNNAEGLSYFSKNIADNLNTNVYEIEYNAGSVIWRINNRTVNSVATLSTPFSNGVNLPVAIINRNSSNCVDQFFVNSRANAIYTLGKGESVARAFFTNATGTSLIKTGPGKLERVILTREAGGGAAAQIDLYDATSATNQIAKVITVADETTEVEFDLNFNDGLFVDVTGGGTISATVTYD